MMSHSIPDWNCGKRSNKAYREGPLRVHRVPLNYSKKPMGFLGNSIQYEVLQIGTYQLKMYTSHTLILCDVLHAPRIRQKPAICIYCDQLQFLSENS